MKIFRNRLRSIIDNSEYKASYRRLSLEAGLSESRISNLLNDTGMDHSHNGPGIFLMRRVADCLGCSLDFLVGRDATPYPQSGTPRMAAPEARIIGAIQDAKEQLMSGVSSPTAREIDKRFVNGDRKIAAISDLIEYVDLYKWPTENGRVIVHRVGGMSLSAQTMGCTEAKTLQDALDQNRTTDLHGKLRNDFSAAHHNGKYGSIEELDLHMPNRPIRVRLIYSRDLYSMSDGEGAEFIVSFCRRIC